MDESHQLYKSEKADGKRSLFHLCVCFWDLFGTTKCTNFKCKWVSLQDKSSITFLLEEKCKNNIAWYCAIQSHYTITLSSYSIILFLPHLYFTVPFCIIYHTTVFVLCRVESFSYHSVKCLYCNSTPLYSHCSLWQCFSTWGSQLPHGTASYSISRRMQDGWLDEQAWKICFCHKCMLLFSDFTFFFIQSTMQNRWPGVTYHIMW